MAMQRKEREALQGEKRRLLAERWESLPESVRVPGQIAGRAAVACGATHHVMERCDFACTCCYLGAHANETEPLPFLEVAQQLDDLRAALGHGGKVQITAGEVTLLPLDELGKIVRYARGIGLDPMVMTHGQRFLEEPAYLRGLVEAYGLRKLSIHVDSTQRGRRGVARGVDELGLNAVRERFARLIRDTRRVSGADLKAASTITVTADNLPQMGEVARWFLRNADAFRMISFQPVAKVGRTRGFHDSSSMRDDLWSRIEAVVGRSLNRAPMQFGHASCNVTVPLVVGRVGEDFVVFEGIRSSSRWDRRVFDRLMELASLEFDFTRSYLEDVWVALKAAARQPWFALEALAYGLWRLVGESGRWGKLCWWALRGRSLPQLRPLLLVVHSFMDAQELDTEEGRERLQACVFKLPVDGKLVSMCEMNASGLRQKIDARLSASAVKSVVGSGDVV